MAKRSARVYQGRFKGSTETHIPNDTMRENYDKMKWASFVPWECPICHKEIYVHKLELKIARCPECERDDS